MQQTFLGRDILGIQELPKNDILSILNQTNLLRESPRPNLLDGQIMASCFFEPSTRTRLSFESAMHRLSGRVIGFSDSENTSVKKGESLHDTMKMVESYADIVVLRHPFEGAARLAAETIQIPVINAGDGAHEHPTQTLVDLYSIQESQGRLDELSILITGDLKYGRTAHSLALGLAHFRPRLYFVSPSAIEMPKHILDYLRSKSVRFSLHPSIREVIGKVDIAYFTRIQEERFEHAVEAKEMRNNYTLTLNDLENVRSNLKILHPLPRVQEIDRAIDASPYAGYFKQASHGVLIRQALLGLILGKLS